MKTYEVRGQILYPTHKGDFSHTVASTRVVSHSPEAARDAVEEGVELFLEGALGVEPIEPIYWDGCQITEIPESTLMRERGEPTLFQWAGA